MSEPSNPRKRIGASPSTPAAAFAPVARPPTRSFAHDDDGPPELTREQIDDLRKRLEERRTALMTDIEGKRGEEREVIHDVGDEMDEASNEGATALSAKLLERDAQLLREINRALEKMREGSYGLCEGTGEQIGFPRLNLRPWARYSVAYQEELEHEARTRGG